MAVEEGWQRRFPIVALDSTTAAHLIHASVLSVDLLSGGLRNTNYKLELTAGPAVLRIYTSDAAACAKEIAVLRLVHGTVPVPRVLDADPSADPPWALLEWIDATRLDKVPADETISATRHAGEVLASIHAFTFARQGFLILTPDLQVGEALGDGLGFVREVIGRQAGTRIKPDLARRLARVVDDNESRLEPLWPKGNLLHCDYKSWNLLARDGRIAAVLDWEFSVAGPPLFDLGIFLRYRHRMPASCASAFLRGYRDGGGSLPDDVEQLTRLIDLINVCTFLDAESIDPAIVGDLEPVILATVEAFDQ